MPTILDSIAIDTQTDLNVLKTDIDTKISWFVSYLLTLKSTFEFSGV